MKPRACRSLSFRTALVAVILGTVAVSTGSAQVGQEPTRRGALRGADGQSFTSADLRKWIDTCIPASRRQDMILVFSQCFGANWFGDFMDYIESDTTLLAASQEDTPSTYTGVHVAYADNLKPTNKVEKLQDEGVKRITGATGGDTVKGAGSKARVIGGVKSTHVLVWASNPAPDDWRDINSVKSNFAGRANTTVTVLAGSADRKDKDGNTTSFAATKGNMQLALATIGLAMYLSQFTPPPIPKSEQFVLFVTDHGDLAVEKKAPAGQLTGGPNEQQLAAMTPEERAAYEEVLRRQKEKQSGEKNAPQNPGTVVLCVSPTEGDALPDVEAKVSTITAIEIGSTLVWNRANPNDKVEITPQYLPSTTDENGDEAITWEDGATFDGFQVSFTPEVPILDAIDPADAAVLRVFYGGPGGPAPLQYDALRLHIGPIPRAYPGAEGTVFQLR